MVSQTQSTKQPRPSALSPTTRTAASTPATLPAGQRTFSLGGIISFISNIAKSIYSVLQRSKGSLLAQISGFPVYTKPPQSAKTTTPSATFKPPSSPKVPPTAISTPSVSPSISRQPQTAPIQLSTTDQQFIQALQQAAKKLPNFVLPTFSTAASTPAIITSSPPPKTTTTTPTIPQPFAVEVKEQPTIQPTRRVVLGTTETAPIPTEKISEKTIIPTENIVEDIVNLSVQKQQQTSAIVSNVPQGETTYIFKDPIGGSTPVFEYVIRPGENLTKIAQRFGVSIEDILRLNKDRTDAIKTPDLIIAGKSIRIPAIQKEVQPSVLTQAGIKTVEDINKAVQEQLKTQTSDFALEDIIQLIEERVSEPLQRIQQVEQQYIQLADPNFYVNQYNALMDKLGIPQDLENLRNIQAIMRGTLEDVLKEAATAGGLVTQSQVAEIVNFRHGILKQQAETLSDIIEEKERMLDQMMKYTLLGREELEKMLDRQLRIAEMEIKLKRDATQWAYDIYQDLKDKNLKRLEFMVKEGVLHTASPEHLSKYVDPSSLLYTGLTPDDLTMMLRISYQNAFQEQLKTQQIIEKIEQAQAKLEQQMRSLELKEKGLELREKELEIRRKKLELEKEKIKGGKRDWSIFKIK